MIRLSNAGFDYIEVSSFVSPKWVPQLADAKDVFAGIQRKKGVTYASLVPNTVGFDSALSCKSNEIAIFGAASESFSKKNINCSIDESLQRFGQVMRLAEQNHIPVRGYISCVVACPYEGTVKPEMVLRVTKKMLQMGCREISLGDTIGQGTPEAVQKLLSVICNEIPVEKLAVHFHDTNKKALDNLTVALNEFKIRTVDSSVGGLGGCPYAGPGVSGNVSTESVLRHLAKLNYLSRGNISVDEVEKIGKWIRDQMLN
ncbi:hypothetical protein Ciccas_008383 [Cichlidogyrus casuarinus]|uniref:hydroxymethylglutaryl-CoA lyase n=1 Tax=Cichlidogyrus casuarinus TaxID=1844966 RepID=A0ABD2Q0W6_9PLAT